MTKIFLIVASAIFISVCPAKNTNKVVGGTMANFENYRHFVGIIHQGHQICGGTILNKNFVLTVASCIVIQVSPFPVLCGNIRVLTGTNDKLEIGNGRVHDVSYSIVHEQYDDLDSWVHDIVLLKLETPIDLSFRSKRIKLPDHYIRARTTVRVPGWGGTRYINDVLMENENMDNCQSIFSDFQLYMNIQGCITSLKTDSGIIDGDSGSPIVHNNILHGMVSIIIPTQQGWAVFIKVRAYRSWIEQLVASY